MRKEILTTLPKLTTRASLLLLLLIFSQFSIGQVVINELDCDTPGVDDKEFIELKSDTPNFDLDGFVLVFFNGSTSGGDSSYFTIDLDGLTTDVNGLLLIGSNGVAPFPQHIISANVIQNGADAVAIYQANDFDFPEGTLATTTNLIDALVYDTSDSDDAALMALLGVSEQINEGPSNNTNSIQRFVDMDDNVTYMSTTPTPRALNDGSGVLFNTLTMSTVMTQYDEGNSFDITITSDINVSSDLIFDISLDNGTFNSSDYTGSTTLTIPNGQNSVSTTITLVDDSDDEGDEELQIQFSSLPTPFIPYNNNLIVRVVDNDFTVAAWGTPTNPTFGIVESTQPSGYYNSLDGLSDTELRQALQDIIADPDIVRAQTYADVIDILKQADQNPLNSNEVWLVYTEQGRAKLDLQTDSNNNGKWNREHTYPRSRGGFDDIEEDEIADGIDVFWATKADSLRHGNSDAHALRAADGPENSIRGNQHYGQYTGPAGTQGSFYGDVARSVLYMEIRYNGLEVVDGFPDTVGQLGDLATLLDWHRNDPPDDYEMNRNNIVYNWQFNRNPFIDQPDLVEYIWGNNVGDTWDQPLSITDNTLSQIKIFPNPATNSIQIFELKNFAEIEVFSSEGRKLSTTKVSSEGKLDLTVASGIYFIKITSENKSIVKKLLVK
ncbi:endonuclease [Winogradskyella sp. 3972H.M.0a.05]|uniref:endonuclease n=1 Tax=Winogradskyella sp. 3972H.M.0a.05 TaxID=2950277 RepID=UPI00339AC8A6